jgi:hypothetical protein
MEKKIFISLRARILVLFEDAKISPACKFSLIAAPLSLPPIRRQHHARSSRQCLSKHQTAGTKSI